MAGSSSVYGVRPSRNRNGIDGTVLSSVHPSFLTPRRPEIAVAIARPVTASWGCEGFPMQQQRSSVVNVAQCENVNATSTHCVDNNISIPGNTRGRAAAQPKPSRTRHMKRVRRNSDLSQSGEKMGEVHFITEVGSLLPCPIHADCYFSRRFPHLRR